MTHPTDALRLVPTKATPQMIAAMDKNIFGYKMGLGSDFLHGVWAAALKAAPASPLPGGGCLGAEHLSAAITRLTQLAAGDEIEAAYADFTFPGHTFRADIRALLSALPTAPTGDAK